MKISRVPKDVYTIENNKTLKDALIVITNNNKGAVIVVDGNGLFQGVASDGDIRRAMVQGATDLTPILKFVNSDAKFLPETATDSEISAIFEESVGITMLPLVNDGNEVTEVALGT